MAFVLMLSVPVMAELPVTSAGSVSIGNVQGFNFSSEAIFENPASLRLKSKASFSSFYTAYMGGENRSIVLSSGYKLTPSISVGAGFVQNSIDGLFYNQENSSNEYESTGIFGFRESHYFVGGSYALSPDCSVGVSGTYMSQQFDTLFGRSIQLNVGGFYHVGELGFSLMGKNILAAKLEFNGGTSQDTYRTVTFGTSYHPQDASELGVFGEVSNVIQGSKMNLLSGVGIGYYLVPDSLQVRGGWREVYSSGKVTSTKSVGLRFDVAPFTINYAYELSDYAVQQDTHFMSLQVDL